MPGFFVSASDIFGIENPKKSTTSHKFGMWSGVGALITVNDLSVVLIASPRGREETACGAPGKSECYYSD